MMLQVNNKRREVNAERLRFLQYKDSCQRIPRDPFDLTNPKIPLPTSQLNFLNEKRSTANTRADFSMKKKVRSISMHNKKVDMTHMANIEDCMRERQRKLGKVINKYDLIKRRRKEVVIKRNKTSFAERIKNIEEFEQWKKRVSKIQQDNIIRTRDIECHIDKKFKNLDFFIVF